MSLQASITGLQEKLAKLYLELEHRFSENQIIRDLWNAMSHDIAEQMHSMTLLPNSFWAKLKTEQDGFSESISLILKQSIEKEGDQSLKSCFDRALQFEEPTISKIYVPVIRKLRENWTNQALDFYIVVKAHLARITRVTHEFAGDPAIIQRSSQLLQQFEKEVQEPPTPVRIPARKGHASPPVGQKEKRTAKPQKKARPKKIPALAKRAESHRTRTKPLVKKIALPRRRVRR